MSKGIIDHRSLITVTVTLRLHYNRQNIREKRRIWESELYPNSLDHSQKTLIEAVNTPNHKRTVQI